MIESATSLDKIKKSICFGFIVSLFILMLFIFCSIFSSNTICVSASSSSFYTPAAPYGNTTGRINVSYEYIVYTSEVGSYWMFDWGDGTYSKWIKVGNSDTFVSQNHSWSSYGNYEVKVKHKSAYMVESVWSNPLTVTIAPPSDSDGDGWSDDMEKSCGTDPKNPNSYPLDTDHDGIPDDSSPDGKYVGDPDDDNDGLSDVLEKSLGSNPKLNSDVTTIFVGDTIYYLVDTNGDGTSDILYNSKTGSQTKIITQGGALVLDLDGDGSPDFVYSDGMLTRYSAPFPWLIVILIIAFVVILSIFILFKKGILYLYKEEYVVKK